MTPPPMPFARRWAAPAFAFNAFVAWLGVGLNMVFSLFDLYVDELPEPGLYGGRAGGLAGAFGRIFDSLSYFTVWSNIVVGISLTLLARHAARGVTSGDRWPRVLRLSALVMISVTGIVYQLLLAPTANVQGVGHITNTLQHIITPLVTVLVWLVFGPRRWIDGRTILPALGLPMVWLGWMFLRGAVDGTYPYDFANVTEYGYGPVLQTSVTVLAFGLVLELVFWGVDRLLSRPSTERP